MIVVGGEENDLVWLHGVVGVRGMLLQLRNFVFSFRRINGGEGQGKNEAT